MRSRTEAQRKSGFDRRIGGGRRIFFGGRDIQRTTDAARKGGSGALAMLEVILKRFDSPDEIRTFEKGKFEIVRISGMTLGRATYEPGWKWSTHVGGASGAKSCQVEHVGVVISGTATAAMNDGTIYELRAGDIFFIPPGHDSWVVGDAPYVSLHVRCADEYAHK